MFGWFKSKPKQPELKTSPANPGEAVTITAAFTNGTSTWNEKVNIVDCMATALKEGGQSFSRHKAWFELEDGILIQPRGVQFQPTDPKGVRTTTTVETSCPNHIPAGVFEFQHSGGENLKAAICDGFKEWVTLDLPVLRASLLAKPTGFGAIQFKFPAEGVKPARARRALLGPVSHYAMKPAVSEAEEHPFCPCCLFTNASKAFTAKVGDEGYYAMRLYAARDSDGSSMADCRINGLDYEAGKQALLEYVARWPDRGLEFRKQYVIVQDQPKAE